MSKYIIRADIVVDWKAEDLVFCLANLETKFEVGKVKIKNFLPVVDGNNGRENKDGMAIAEGIEIEVT